MSVDLIEAFSRALEKAKADRPKPDTSWPPRRLDHTPCEAQCSRMVCACEDALCVGYFDNACDHGPVLCEDCRGACVECRGDRADDAGVPYVGAGA